jgi:2EXR family
MFSASAPGGIEQAQMLPQFSNLSLLSGETMSSTGSFEQAQTSVSAEKSSSVSAPVDPKSEERTFTLFPKLPIKLRAKIWMYFSKQGTRHVAVVMTYPEITALSQRPS